MSEKTLPQRNLGGDEERNIDKHQDADQNELIQEEQVEKEDDTAEEHNPVETEQPVLPDPRRNPGTWASPDGIFRAAWILIIVYFVMHFVIPKPFEAVASPWTATSYGGPSLVGRVGRFTAVYHHTATILPGTMSIPTPTGTFTAVHAVTATASVPTARL